MDKLKLFKRIADFVNAEFSEAGAEPRLQAVVDLADIYLGVQVIEEQEDHDECWRRSVEDD